MQKILHIGSKKTASTWLQEVVFPRLRHVRFQPDRAYWRDQLYWPSPSLPWPESDRPILVSDENLEGRNPFGLIEFRRMVRDLAEAVDDAVIMYVFREQRGRLASGYQESVRWGNTRRFHEWILPTFTRLNRPDATVLRAFDYWERYQILTRALGEDRVCMVPMEGIFRQDPVVMERLDGLLGPDFSQVVAETKEIRTNESMVLWMLRFLRFVNRFERSTGFSPTLRDQQKLRRKILQKASVKIGTRKARKRLKEHLLDQVDRYVDLDQYAEGNTRLAEALGIDLGSLGYRVT